MKKGTCLRSASRDRVRRCSYLTGAFQNRRGRCSAQDVSKACRERCVTQPAQDTQKEDPRDLDASYLEIGYATANRAELRGVLNVFVYAWHTPARPAVPA